VQVVEHPGCGDEDDASGVEAGAVCQRAGEEGLSGAGETDEERIDAFLEKREVVQSEVARA
jgi:hypothetical protein